MSANKPIILRPPEGDLSRNQKFAAYAPLAAGFAICAFGLAQDNDVMKVLSFFVGAAVTGLSFAFACSIRNRREYETLSFDNGELRIDHFTPASQRPVSFKLDAYFARAEIVMDKSKSGTAKKRIKISSRKDAVFVGEFLPPESLDDVANDITEAIRSYNAPQMR